MAAFKYLLLNSQGYAVGRASTDSAPQGDRWHMHIDDGDLQTLKSQSFLSLVGNSEKVPSMEARVIACEGRDLILEPVRPLDGSVRKNLRIPTGFSSFAYPVTGRWKGRAVITADNLSSGGMAFYCDRELEDGELVQVVIPITAQPLLLNMEILRSTNQQAGRLYAARFVDLLREEESMLRESVFNLQLRKG